MKKEIQRDEFIRKRAERQRKIRKRRLAAFFIFFIILLLCIGIVLSLTVFFPIMNIKSSGSKIYSSEEIIKFSGIENGDNLFATSCSETEKLLKKNLPYIDSVTFKRTLPDTIEIKVKDAQEFACYLIDGEYYTVSKNGWVLKKSDKQPKNLYVVKAKGVKCSVGAEAIFSDDLQRELLNSISNSLSEEELSVNLIDVSNTVSIKLKVEGRFTVELGTSNNIKEKIQHLSSMIEKIPAQKSGNIDLSMWTSTNTQGTFVAKNEQ